jgi:hypothetical protein
MAAAKSPQRTRRKPKIDAEAVAAWQKLLHGYDAQVEWWSIARAETRDQSLYRNLLAKHFPAQGDPSQAEEWLRANPKSPTVQYNAAFEGALRDAAAFFQSPPPQLREFLSRLAGGEELEPGELPDFVRLFSDYRAHSHILWSYDPEADELERQRTNTDKLAHFAHRLYAAYWLTTWIENEAWQRRWPARGDKPMARARRAFESFVLPVASGSVPPPPGWSPSWFKVFLEDSAAKAKRDAKRRDKPVGAEYLNYRLANSYSLKLTEPEIEKLIDRNRYPTALPPLEWEGCKASES